MDESLLKLDVIIRNSSCNTNDIFSNENSVESMKEIIKNLKVLNFMNKSYFSIE